jgi:hypothetical protein
MENDDATAGGVRSAVQAQMVAAALGMAKSGLTREQLVEQLRISMGDACDAARAIGVPNADDRVGSAHEFKLGLADLVRVQKGDTVQTTMEISGDGGKYRLRFEAKPA